MFIDSHCHLEGELYDADRAEVLRRAAAAGVEAVLAIGNGVGPGTFAAGIRLAEEFDSANQNPDPSASPPQDASQTVAGLRIYSSIGIHPHEAKIANDKVWQELEQLAHHPKVIAWGEIGLDYWYDFSPREVQRNVFVRQMELARAAGKPIIIHCRPSAGVPYAPGAGALGRKQSAATPAVGHAPAEDAWDDLLRLLKQHWASSGLGGILHCFGGSAEQMRAGLEMGFMISFAGNVSFPKAAAVQAAARQAPLERMLIETDSPYLAPLPHRGRRNEPAYVIEVARTIATLRDLPVEQIGALTRQNFYRFFKLRP